MDGAALVTGASQGIGRAIALAWAQAGGHLVLVGRRRSALEKVAAEAANHGAVATLAVLDLADPSDLGELMDRVRSERGRLDAVIHAAGLYGTGPGTLEEMHEADALWRVNVRAPLALSLACVGLLRESQGEIVFVNSSVVNSPAAPQTAYAASKRALVAVADSVRARFNADGIRVLSVYPGRTATPMQKQIFDEEGRPYRPERLLQAEDVASAVIHAMSLPRTAEVTDLHLRPFLKFD
jgi:short-subunit dehydrogenase